MIRFAAFIFAPLFAIMFSTSAEAQKRTINRGVGIGFQINQFQQDFGLGVQINTPQLWGNGAVIRLKSNVVFHEHLKQGIYEWSAYQNFALGIAGYGGWVTQNIRIYGEGGVMGLIPSSSFSSESFEIGGYGSFGTELYASEGFHYFLEIGVATTQARADLLAGSPFYHNGFFTTMGLRFNFKGKKDNN